MSAMVPYDEMAYFHENAEEYGVPWTGPPKVRREDFPLRDGRKLSGLVWGDGAPEYVFLHGGAQNAHTWDTVALALQRPLIAIDLPGHGHSDGPAASSIDPQGNAADVADVVRAAAPSAKGVIGMSLGGLTAIALGGLAPELVRAMVLVDVTPGVNERKGSVIAEFINGPESFPNFDEILARTVEYNPTRTVSSLRRGILHNAQQREDGSWVWRYMRFRGAEQPAEAFREFGKLWDTVSGLKMPVMLVRGMRSQSVVDDEDETELLRRLPNARIEHVTEAGHSVQGDTPVELAQLITSFIP
jgi:pimeloyl-ACP methyl ester carboxylesterase